MGIKLVSFTSLNSPGGVPRWNRDFIECFPEAEHFSIEDYPFRTPALMEFDLAGALNHYLKHVGKLKKDDIIIVDGFWGLGLEEFPNVVSVCHGIWSHLIKEEADAGYKPDNPANHAVQVRYRKKHLERGGKLVSVSRFIQYQMKEQWGFESEVINNAIDTEKFVPTNIKHKLDKPLIIHGVNDKNNKVKGWDHIKAVADSVDAYVFSLDEAYDRLNHRAHIFGTSAVTKYEVLAMADLVLIPSAYEGNSYFLLESLSCGVPVVAYDVGLVHELCDRPEFYKRSGDLEYELFGLSLPRSLRSKEETVFCVKSILEDLDKCFYRDPRLVAKEFSIENFKKNWKEYLKKEFDYGT